MNWVFFKAAGMEVAALESMAGAFRQSREKWKSQENAYPEDNFRLQVGLSCAHQGVLRGGFYTEWEPGGCLPPDHMSNPSVSSSKGLPSASSLPPSCPNSCHSYSVTSGPPANAGALSHSLLELCFQRLGMYLCHSLVKLEPRIWDCVYGRALNMVPR